MNSGYAVVKGLAKAGIEFAVACPATQAAELIPIVLEVDKPEGASIRAEWAVNERCAFEVAYGAAAVGAKAACFMGRSGLNIAFPSLMQAREKKIEGAFVIVCCDDAGDDALGAGQDIGLLATLFRIPFFSPSSPEEAAGMACQAVEQSFQQKVPVIIRTTNKVGRNGESAPCSTLGQPSESFHDALSAAIKAAFPDALFLDDRGHSGSDPIREADDAVFAEGSSVALAGGFYDVCEQEGKFVPIIASMESTTFFHSCLPALYDAVQKRKRYVLLIIDSGAVMTGMETGPQPGGTAGLVSARIEEVARGLGVVFSRSIDRSVSLVVKAISEALEYLKRDDALPVVIVVQEEKKGLGQ